MPAVWERLLANQGPIGSYSDQRLSSGTPCTILGKLLSASEPRTIRRILQHATSLQPHRRLKCLKCSRPPRCDRVDARNAAVRPLRREECTKRVRRGGTVGGAGGEG